MSGNYKYSGTRDQKVLMYGEEDFLVPLHHRFGDRFNNYRKEWDRVSNTPGYLPEYPLFLDVEPQYKCNLRCVTCALQFGKGNPSYIKDKMTPDFFAKICDESRNYNLPAISVSNNNEGLIQKYLFEYISIASDAGIMDIFCGTNGLLLDEQMSKMLIESNLTRLLVSIDAATPETYKLVRRSERYDRVVSNTKRFKKMRDASGSRLPLLRVSLVVNSLNTHEENMFREMWEEDADIISIQRYITPSGDDSIKDPLIPLDRESLDSSICSSLWHRMTIRANGDVIACCHQSNKLKVGNLSSSSIHDLWHSERMTLLRKMHLEGNSNENALCRSCMS